MLLPHFVTDPDLHVTINKVHGRWVWSDQDNRPVLSTGKYRGLEIVTTGTIKVSVDTDELGKSDRIWITYDGVTGNIICIKLQRLNSTELEEMDTITFSALHPFNSLVR